MPQTVCCSIFMEFFCPGVAVRALGRSRLLFSGGITSQLADTGTLKPWPEPELLRVRRVTLFSRAVARMSVFNACIHHCARLCTGRARASNEYRSRCPEEFVFWLSIQTSVKKRGLRCLARELLRSLLRQGNARAALRSCWCSIRRPS